MAVSCMRNASGHNYRNSSIIVDVAMGQIPRSTERIYSWRTIKLTFFGFFRFTTVLTVFDFKLVTQYVYKTKPASLAPVSCNTDLTSVIWLESHCGRSCEDARGFLGRYTERYIKNWQMMLLTLGSTSLTHLRSNRPLLHSCALLYTQDTSDTCWNWN